MKKKTHEEYVNELKSKNPNIEVIDTYINTNVSIQHHCLVHDIYWNTTPSRALRGVGCPKCHVERFAKSKTKTQDEYLELLKKNNPNIIPLEKYINCRTPILHKCLRHNIEWNTIPDSVINGHGCCECSKEKASDKNRKTHEQYVQEVKSINPNIIVVGEYTRANVNILHKCAIDGYEWYAAPGNILFGNGCPKCSGNIKKSHEDYVNEVYAVNQNIEVLGEYKSARTHVLHKCKIDGHEWYAYPYSILSGTGCPKCNESKGERKISHWLNNHNITYISQKRFDDCRDKLALPFDFYLPDYNIAIEYDGEQHYRPIEYFGGKEHYDKVTKHDRIKDDYCKSNNIDLLRIPYYANIENELNNFLFI